jgi:putative protease
LPFRLEDATGKVMSRNSHMLSLKDMNRSDSLEDLLDAGVVSFKIEGRLKEISYVKTVTTTYRKKLDEIFARRPEFKRLSSGTTRALFTPAPEKTYNRGFTNYYVDRKTQQPQQLWNYDSPKAMGELVGTVKAIHGNHFTVAGTVQLNNGDGLCFMNEKGDLSGFRVNRVEENRVFPAEMPKIALKTELFRNWDHEFEKLLSKPTAERNIDVSIELAETQNGFTLSFRDEDGFVATESFEYEKQLAQTAQNENITKQLSKLGNTIFKAKEVKITFQNEWFIPASQLADWRRMLVDSLLAIRKKGYKRDLRIQVDKDKMLPYPEKTLTYLGNVSNSKAELFYRKHDVTEIAPAFELKKEKNVPLMFTKHCVKYSLKICPVHQKKDEEFAEPFYIHNDGLRFRLEFDCKNCQMLVFGD